LRPKLRHQRLEQGETVDWKLTSDLVKRWEIVLIISHINLGESCVLEVVVVAVRCIHLRVILLDKVLNIGESDSLLVDSDVLEKISKITPSGFINIGENTILILSVVLEAGISLDFIVDLVSEDVLISKKVSNLVF